MKVEILYDEYNTKIEKATLLFGEDVDQQLTELDVLKKVEGEDENQITVDVVKLTSIDSDSMQQIENELSKDDLRVFMTLLRNLLSQLK